MSMYLKSYASSSSGNCLAVWTGRTAILIDCGLGSMKRTRQMLADLGACAPPVAAVVVSHLHSDHIGHYPLRALELAGVAVRVHERCIEPLGRLHFNGYGFCSLALQGNTTESFTIGDLHVEPFSVSHYPGWPTFGFVIRSRAGRRWFKAVVATDFNRPDDVRDHLIDADFIFIESNHDLELLRRYYNPNSRYHMPNPRTAELLCQARLQSKRPPAAVMLAHLSPQRNRPKIALDTIQSHFREYLIPQDFPLHAAPQATPSQILSITD